MYDRVGSPTLETLLQQPRTDEEVAAYTSQDEASAIELQGTVVAFFSMINRWTTETSDVLRRPEFLELMVCARAHVPRGGGP